jgi:hypothetical protein
VLSGWVRVDPMPLRPFPLEMIGLTDVDDTARLLLSILQGPVGIYKIRTASNSFAASERTPPLRGRPGS